LMNSAPSITKLSSPYFMMPTSLAIALAVIILSPVTILTFIPALWHLMMAPGTYFLGMSRTPKIVIKISSVFSISKTPFSSLLYKSQFGFTFL
jgi:hypothetical protein